MLLLVKSSIKPQLLRKTLLRGTLIAALGALLIVATGMLLPLFLLRVFGFPVLLMGFALITFGLFPYRRLSKLEMHPYEIGCKNNSLLFIRDKKLLFKLDIEAIEKLDYLEKESVYGIGLRLIRPIKNRVTVCDKSYEPSIYVTLFDGYDLFLPYFTSRSVHELREALDEEEGGEE